MLVATVQTSPRLGDPTGNLGSALEFISMVEADLFVLPELFNTGYAFKDGEQVEALAETVHGRTVSCMSALAAKRRCWICGGFAEKSDVGIYNSAFLVGPNGLAAVYRKTHLFGLERDLFLPGDTGFSVQDIGHARVGMMICFDWIFPEAARSLALQGADIILHPANLVLPYCPDAMITRCIENGVFAVTADRVGEEEGPSGRLGFIGRSQVVSPKGELLARASDCSEDVLVVRIEPMLARSKALMSGNDLFKDRRPSFYKL